MKGRIKNIGKNGVKNYFFIKGEDGNKYFANIRNVKSNGEPKEKMFPYIWEGAIVKSFDVETSSDGKTQATNIILSDHVSIDKRYWNGRTDSLKEFAYWYMEHGENAGFKQTVDYLNQMIGWAGSRERRQPVMMCAWRDATKYPPKENTPVLLQAYDKKHHVTTILVASRFNNVWYMLRETTQLPKDAIKLNESYIPEAWTLFPHNWENHS